MLPNPYEPPNGTSESQSPIEPKATWHRIYIFSHLSLSVVLVAASLCVLYKMAPISASLQLVGQCGLVITFSLFLLGCIQFVRSAIRAWWWRVCFWGVDSFLSLVTLNFACIFLDF